MVPGLEQHLMDSPKEELVLITNLVHFVHPCVLDADHKCWQIQKGALSARSDDTKSLKSTILNWITLKGQTLNPPLARNVKID
jgi:hypothetical protein